ncbi:hypothetical protein J3R83DRAFT_2543 [Lanmaoa asiatica]|nr:hypothetical protein J3R83DRAFT_2543 [Lanmaoa asiatica]
MKDHLEHGRSAQEAHPQYNNTPLVRENDGAAGTSSGKGGSDGRNLPPSNFANDDEARANSDLLTAWTQRLQALTVVTTFLASMDGQLFSLTALNTQIGLPAATTSRELVYACLSGALVFHICACILGYVASFALIRYRIIDAIDEDEAKVGGISSGLGAGSTERLSCLPVSRSPRSPPPPPLSLLTHCYYTTLCLTAFGFILALIGILAYAWVGLPTPVGISTTICLGVGISAGLWALAM